MHPKNATTVKVNGIDLTYDTFGEAEAPAMLLIMGLGAQMISWDDVFCAQLAAQGYHVIRFDNRDVGHSTKFELAGVPNLQILAQAWAKGEIPRIPAAYTLLDMANDAIGLLDALAIVTTHVVGLSLGGMIAQLMVIHHPTRVRTLTSMMSMTGDLSIWSPQIDVLWTLLSPPPADREAYIEQSVENAHLFQGPGYPVDEARTRRRAAQAYDRGLNPAGTARQLAAIIASLGWKEQLFKIHVPTLVIHGDADPLIPLEGGLDTADSIPGAQLMVLEGLGHALPPAVWPQVIQAIASHAS